MVAIIPVEDMLDGNVALDGDGYGPGNFSVAAYIRQGTRFGALHSWDNADFEAAVAALPGVDVDIGLGDPVARTDALIQSKSAVWGEKAPELPNEGVVTADELYRYGPELEELWTIIQTFDRSVFGEPPETYPALMRRVRQPGEVLPWVQPIDQYDAYKLVNPFNGQPDQCTHVGETWVVTDGDAAGNNVWEPGVFGWAIVGEQSQGDDTWVDTGATVIAQAGTIYQISDSTVAAALTLNQEIRFGDGPETFFKNVWAGGPDYIVIDPFVQAAVGDALWAKGFSSAAAMVNGPVTWHRHRNVEYQIIPGNVWMMRWRKANGEPSAWRKLSNFLAGRLFDRNLRRAVYDRAVFLGYKGKQPR